MKGSISGVIQTSNGSDLHMFPFMRKAETPEVNSLKGKFRAAVINLDFA